MGKRHPIVEEYISSTFGGRPLLAFLEDYPEKTPVIEVLTFVRQALAGKQDKQEALRLARNTELRNEDPDLALIFLYSWLLLCQDMRLKKNLPLLFQQMRLFLGKHSPDELKWMVSLGENLLYGFSDKIRRSKELVKRVPRSSPKKFFVAYQLGAYLSQEGLLGRWATELDRFLPENAFAGDEWCRLLRLINAVQIGDVTEGRKQLRLGFEDPVLISRRGDTWLLEYQCLLELMEKPIEDLDGFERKLEGFPYVSWVHVLFLLKLQKPRQALQEIRALILDEGDLPEPVNRIKNFNLIRAELATCNPLAALRLLERKETSSKDSFIKGLFFARAFELLGKPKKARGYFQETFLLCKKHHALGRLNFELALSSELSPLALLGWREGGVVSLKSRPEQTEKVSELEKKPDALLGKSAVMFKIKDQIDKFAVLDPCVLISGETGVGKELVARALHDRGPRAKHPFLSINCGAISETLLESELFGHMKGAFTGADTTRKGLFEDVGVGTIFLDEIGEISDRLQVALLRVLETGDYRPLGGNRTKKIQCRVVAATNADLEQMVEDGVFRADLYFRLKRLEILLPPLRMRSGDAVLLARHFLNEGRKGEKAILSEGLCDALEVRRWPGNVRELKNVIERMRLLHSDKTYYDVSDLEYERASSPRKRQVGLGQPASTGEAFVKKETTKFRRLEKLRALFAEQERLSRIEIATHFGIALNTTTSYLKALIQEGVVEKVMPTPSPKTHYFQWKG